MGDLVNSLLDFWWAVRMPFGAFLCLVGGALCLIGAVGVMRFPDFYTRLHAASVTDTGGVILVLAGMACMVPNWLVLAKLFFIFFFLFLTSPAASHAVANAAHVAGLQPLIGRIGKSEEEEDA